MEIYVRLRRWQLDKNQISLEGHHPGEIRLLLVGTPGLNDETQLSNQYGCSGILMTPSLTLFLLNQQFLLLKCNNNFVV
jgi:hypothetical protein